MADLTTVSGGAQHGTSALSPAEHQAAIQALAKLEIASPTQGIASVLGGSLRSATLKGGALVDSAGRGADTFAGGVHTGATPEFKAIGSDTVVAGSAISGKSDPASRTDAPRTLHITADTINVAGTTAAAVKQDAASTAKGSHTITLSDKTTVTLTGVTPHTIVKPH